MIRRRWHAVAIALALTAAAARADAQTVAELFDDRVLHDVELWVHGDDWLRLRDAYRENTYYPADVSWNGVRVRNVGIRSRGNASRDPNKPGLRVDMNRYVSGERFLGLKSFILDNSTQDASFLKQRLAFRLFERLGIPAPRQAHARVFVNGAYHGLYLLVESVDKDMIERAYAGRPTHRGTPERDGVLLDYRWVEPYYFTYLGPDLGRYAQRFEAQTHESASPEFLWGPVRDLARVIEEAPDDRFVEWVNAFLDLAQWVRYVAVDTALAEEDGMLGFAGMNNFYLYRFEDSTVSQVIPWDKDKSFESATKSIWHNADTNLLMRRAMRVPELRALYLQTLAEAAHAMASPAEDDPRGWLDREAAFILSQISEAALADATKPWSNEAFLSEVGRVHDVVRTRAAFVLCEVANEPLPAEARQPCAATLPEPGAVPGAPPPPPTTAPPPVSPPQGPGWPGQSGPRY